MSILRKVQNRLKHVKRGIKTHCDFQGKMEKNKGLKGA